jgi:hypothetical protein
LIKNESNGAFNGIYVWTNATTITRADNEDTAGVGTAFALGLNDYFFVSSGNVNAGSAWVVDAPSGTITFGTSNITFAQFSSSQTYTANTAAGVSLAGTVINAKVDNITTAFDGTGNISVKASATLTTPNIGVATGTSVSVTGNITGGNLNAGGLSLSGNVVSPLNITGNVTGANVNATTGMYVGGVSVLTVNATVDGGTY